MTKVFVEMLWEWVIIQGGDALYFLGESDVLVDFVCGDCLRNLDHHSDFWDGVGCLDLSGWA